MSYQKKTENTANTPTIAAIATPLGAGGIGIVRISGSRALPILKQIFSPHTTSCRYTSHRFYYGHILIDERVLDEVMAVFMRSPHSYTCEDVVEIHCHGSRLILENILTIVIQAGARLAEAGEFTKRAFLNGRIDLTQAEAVLDILTAQTRKGVDIAQKQLAGALFQAIEPIRNTLLRVRAHIEVAIDFPDDEQEILNYQDFIVLLENDVIASLHKLLRQAGQGRLYRDGISLVIAGVPNVGKSSLLNAFLQEKRALVADLPGTTRDSIEEVVDIGGIPVRLIDTAGIRDGAEQLEILGIERAKKLIASADVVLFLVDGARDFSIEDSTLFSECIDKELLIVVNKCDLPQQVDLPEIITRRVEKIGGSIHISAHTGVGIDTLREKIFHLLTKESSWEETACTPNLRHQTALKTALSASLQVVANMKMGLTCDLVAVDLQQCLNALGDIIGESTTEDVLDIVFREFCLGK